MYCYSGGLQFGNEYKGFGKLGQYTIFDSDYHRVNWCIKTAGLFINNVDYYSERLVNVKVSQD